MIYLPALQTKPSIPGKNGGHISLIMMIGCLALLAVSTASAVSPPPDGGYPGGNTAEGTDALLSLSSGTNNTAIGADALANNVSGHDNTAVGFQTLLLATGNHNTAVGSEALFFDTSGHDNTATGFQALLNNTSGIQNVASGAFALINNQTGDFNTATGTGALQANIGGDGNTATGTAALSNNTSGSNNTANGINALFFNKTASNNTAGGVNALLNNTGGNNSANGAFALQTNGAGHDNTATGFQALNGNSSGNNNVAVGSHAGANLTTGNNNIDLGANVVGAAAEANTIRIGKQGTQKAAFIAGIFGTAVSGSPVVIGSNGKLGVATSSARFKETIKPMDKASDAVLALKPVTFRYKKEIDPEGTPQFGLIAEEVEKVDPQLVARDEDGKVMTVRYEAVNAMLLNEFLKEHQKVEELRAIVRKQEATNSQQQKQIEALTAGLQKVTTEVETHNAAPRVVSRN
jgi:Chaperone of endosialidase